MHDSGESPALASCSGLGPWYLARAKALSVGLSNAAGAEPTAQLPPASGFERLRVDNTKSEEKS